MQTPIIKIQQYQLNRQSLKSKKVINMQQPRYVKIMAKPIESFQSLVSDQELHRRSCFTDLHYQKTTIRGSKRSHSSGGQSNYKCCRGTAKPRHLNLIFVVVQSLSEWLHMEIPFYGMNHYQMTLTD